MSTVFQWSGAGLADPTLLGITTAGTGDGTFDAVAAGAPPTWTGGTIQVGASTSTGNFRKNGLGLTQGALRFYFTNDGLPTASGAQFLHANNSAGVRILVLSLGTTGTWSLQNTTAGVVSTSPSMVLGAQYRVELYWDSAVDMLAHLSVYDSSNTRVWNANVSIGVAPAVSTIIFGRISNVSSGPLHYANIKMDNVGAYIGPIAGPAVTQWKIQKPGPVFNNVNFSGVWSGGLVVPHNVGKFVGSPVSRSALRYPFQSSDPFNTPVGSGAVFEGATGTATAQLLTGAGEPGMGGVNYSTYSVKVGQALSTSPNATVTDTQHGGSVSIKIPLGFVPPIGASATAFDGNSVIVQPDGKTAHDFYKMAKTSDTVWTCTRIIAQDMTGTAINAGVRASSFALAAGLIRLDEAAARQISHALVMSIPKEMLKLTPVSADGQTMPVGATGIGVKAVWPAKTQDNQTNVPYTGSISMGSYFAIPKSVDLTTLGLTADGMAIGLALQNYGVYLGDQSSSIRIYADPNLDGVTAANYRAAWRLPLMGLLRRVMNNTSTSVNGGGTYPVDLILPPVVAVVA